MFTAHTNGEYHEVKSIRAAIANALTRRVIVTQELVDAKRAKEKAVIEYQALLEQSARAIRDGEI